MGQNCTCFSGEHVTGDAIPGAAYHTESAFHDGDLFRPDTSFLKRGMELAHGGIPACLNAILDQHWESLSSYIIHSLQNDLEPLIQTALGRFGTAFFFVRSKCSLGSRPFHCKEIKASPTSQDTETGPLANSALSLDLEWDCKDISVFIEFKGHLLGITDLRVLATLVVEFVGAMDEPPFFSGLAHILHQPSTCGFKAYRQAGCASESCICEEEACDRHR